MRAKGNWSAPRKEILHEAQRWILREFAHIFVSVPPEMKWRSGHRLVNKECHKEYGHWFDHQLSALSGRRELGCCVFDLRW